MNTDLRNIVILFSDKSTASLLPSEFQLKLIPHTKYDKILCISWKNSFYELQSCSLQKYTTWFIDQRISSSQFLYLANKIDPKFIVLTDLEKSGANGKFSPLDQLIDRAAFSLFDFANHTDWKLDELCDVNNSFGDDCLMYRYNKEKTMTWLKKKVLTVSRVLMAQRLRREQRQQPSFVGGFQGNIEKTLGAGVDQASDLPSCDDIRISVEIVSDYLSDSLMKLLLAEYDLKVEDFTGRSSLGKRKADWEIALEVSQPIDWLLFSYVYFQQAKEENNFKPQISAQNEKHDTVVKMASGTKVGGS
jgi:hypothetical protein